MTEDELSFRPGWPDEQSRATRVCPEGARGSEIFVAVQSRPTERLVAAAWWRLTLPHLDAAPRGVFTWRTLPAIAQLPQESAFLDALASHVAATGRTRILQTKQIFKDQAPAVSVLRQAGFSPHATNVMLRTEFEETVREGRRFQHAFRKMDTSAWILEYPKTGDIESIARLIGKEQDLYSIDEVRRALRFPRDPHRLFDATHSTVLRHGESGELVGVELCRKRGDHCIVPALVINSHPELPPGLGFSLLSNRTIDLIGESEPPSHLSIQIDPVRNEVMFRMAFKIGYREIYRASSYARELGPVS
jgi:hypothetical protein